MNELGNHLWQSTAFAAAAALFTLALRRNSARIRYWIWLAASIKFLVPFSLLLSAGRLLQTPAATFVGVPATRVEQIATSFAPLSFAPVASRQIGSLSAASFNWVAILAAVWIAGALLLSWRWLAGWRKLRAATRESRVLPLGLPIPVRSTPIAIEPGVFGIVRPVLLLPEGIGDRLTGEQLDAIVAHELCHMRYRDNLAAAVHTVVEAIFWFHPLVWWIGISLVRERERACDESVLGQGRRPDVYAHGILNVCKFYMTSPVRWAPGITSADLKQRIREIMLQRRSDRLTAARKLGLVSAAFAALAVPVTIGYLCAQTLPPPPSHTYEVVSIKPAGGPGAQGGGSRIGPGAQGGLRTQNTTAMQLLTFAYDVRDFQFTGAPNWVTSYRMDVNFTPDKPEPQVGPTVSRAIVEGVFSRHRQRMQAVLRDRFGLVLRAETRQMPVYVLTIAKGGHKLAAPATSGQGPSMSSNSGQIRATGAYLSMLANSLSSQLGRPVMNETGLDGPFDFKMEWTPTPVAQPPSDGAGSEAPAPLVEDRGSIFSAIVEQLGLRLESKRGPAPVFVIEKIEKPTEN